MASFINDIDDAEKPEAFRRCPQIEENDGSEDVAVLGDA